MERLAVFGGTFNPVHLGHLIAAEEVRFVLGLDKVLFVPAADPPHKPSVELASASHRVRMLELALAGQPAFRISRADLDRPGPHYTVDMLRRIRAEHGEAVELYAVLGEDSLVDLPGWHDPAGIADLARIVVVARPGYSARKEALEAAAPGLWDRLIRIEGPLVGIAASDIVRRAREGRPITFQVPAAVEAYIRREGLYPRKETTEC